MPSGVSWNHRAATFMIRIRVEQYTDSTPSPSSVFPLPVSPSPPMITVTERIVIPESELEFTFARSSGPGGQNVNKVNSKATLRWKVVETTALPIDVRERFVNRFRSRLTLDGDLLVTSQRYRDQSQNIEDCREKVAAMVREVITPPKRRRPTKPTRGSQQRRLNDKRQHRLKKEGRRSGGDSG